MSMCRSGLIAVAGCAALLIPAISHAQEPSWEFEMLDTPPLVTVTTGVTPFDRASSFGSPLLAGLPLPQLTYTWAQGSAPTPGKIEIGGLAVEPDDPATGFSILIVPGSISNELGTGALNDDSTPNGATDFFEQNTADITNPLGDPTWAGAIIQAGNDLTLDLGTLDLTKVLAYYDALGPGTYDLTMDLGVAAYNAANGDPLDPDPNIPGNSLPRIPGPPTVEMLLTVQPGTQGPPPNGTPEPGSVATVFALTAAGGFVIRRRRSK